MKDRILKIMEYEGMNYAKFAETIGIQRPAMSHIISERNNPSLEVYKKILETFKYIDPDWLLNGSGNMMRGNKLKEPDLFSNIAVNPPKVQLVSENHKEIEVQPPQITIKQIEPEIVAMQKSDSKKVDKIMIFYTDDTFDTFVPEKTKKTELKA